MNKDPKPEFDPYDPRSKTGNERYGDFGSNKALYLKDLQEWEIRQKKKLKTFRSN